MSTFENSPSIFSEAAPESVAFPYITFRILRMSAEDSSVQKFTIFLDYWDYDLSRSTARKAGKRLERLLDNIILQHDDFKSIRIFYFDDSFIQESDPRTIHLNMQLSARAGRLKWASQF